MTPDPNEQILLVEDDANLGTLLCEYLNAKGFNAVLATNGEEGYNTYKKGNFRLCILDVMMPIKDGFTLAREIRATDKQIPIIFLTAKSMKEDTIQGFRAGGDDYISKPFSMEELLLRIQAIIRRSSGYGSNGSDQVVFEFGNFTFDANHRTLKTEKQSYKLTSKENQLLRLLAQNINTTLSREAALKIIWGDDNYFNARSMDVYIAKLRKYFKIDGSVEIVNIHGKGFKLIINE